ncbi:hypothetical protein HETIRDRAFT_453912 [Heterobasidion irregulare TC 32-1]|uniref:Uncharacterized protein n=1 Tax=Heterobasidion irregulare (strain TC 32-1) TaxID=747525 RepID=W4JWG7_HETIT|nr:uncharacterized protein HETIRDRAFT_453912 [Heterobasidion irregulare TC 32-1]ETW77784.1 hypothetical protein HETIRDRAFT_453912 [Heterobasidion irregulare TC 32-1]
MDDDVHGPAAPERRPREPSPTARRQQQGTILKVNDVLRVCCVDDDMVADVYAHEHAKDDDTGLLYGGGIRIRVYRNRCYTDALSSTDKGRTRDRRHYSNVRIPVLAVEYSVQRKERTAAERMPFGPCATNVWSEMSRLTLCSVAETAAGDDSIFFAGQQRRLSLAGG